MTISGRTSTQKFESYCPQWLTGEGNPVRLYTGTLDKLIQRIMITLDVHPGVVEGAVKKKVDLLTAKHPPIFRPVRRLVTDQPREKTYADLLKHDITVCATRTNMDIIQGGLNDRFCELPDIEVGSYLVRTHETHYKKPTVCVSVDHTQRVREVLAAAGAGTQDDYTSTSFTSIGHGQSIPEAGAQPAIGKIGEIEQVQEAKAEVILPEAIEKRVIQAMRSTHPYEEPTYDLFAVDEPVEMFGLRRVGELPQKIFIEAFVEQVRGVLQPDRLRIVQPENAKSSVERIAICDGSGEKFYPQAIAQRTDVYITGDIYYHTVHDMQSAGLIVIDPGHYIRSSHK